MITFLLAGIIIFITHYVGAIAAYGSTLLALPLLLLVAGNGSLDKIVVVLLLVGTVQSLQVLAHTYRDIDWKIYLLILVVAGLFMPAGLFWVREIPSEPVIISLGILLIAGGLWRLLARESRLNLRKPAQFALLALTGLIHGAYACGGMPLTVYLQSAVYEKEKFRATISMVWVTVNTVLIIVHLAAGTIGIGELKLGALALPLVLLSTWIGQRSAGVIPQVTFVKIISAVLAIGGVVTVFRGFF